MFRAAANQIVRRTAFSSSSSSRAIAPSIQVGFHTSSRRESDATVSKDVAKPAADGDKPGWFHIMYSIPLGLTFAIPIIHYEWYVINEETQMAGCFLAFAMLFYREVGQSMASFLAEDGIKTLKEQNEQEDRYINYLKAKHEELLLQDNIVQDNKDVLALKYQTYEHLNEAGKIKPLHDFKGQIEKALSIIAVEETNAKEKGKTVLMEEATAAVRNMLLTDKKIQKLSLDNAIAQLQGKKDTPDVVQNAYLDFFKAKKALKIDEATEIATARANIVTRLNAIASTEGFMFKFAPDGKPTMLSTK